MRPTLDELRQRAAVIVGHGSQPRPGSWRWESDRRIAEAHDEKGSCLTDAEIRDLYPWGERKYLPYKMWLAAKKAYRERFGFPRRQRRATEGARMTDYLPETTR